MNSKFFVVGVAVLTSSVWWIGCGGSSAGTTDTTDGGSGGEAGTSEAGTSEAGTDLPEAGVDAAITGPLLDIQYKGCTPLAPCGGDPKGLWKLSGGCVDEGLFAAAKQGCPGLVESNVKIQARGTVYADATTIGRKTEVTFTATFAVPKSCKDANPLGPTCKNAEAGIKFAGIKTATCKDAAVGGGCDCDVANTVNDDTSDTYTTSGNTLTTGTAAKRTFDYCIAGAKFDYTETTADAIPAVFTLTK